ncbi:MAG: NAD(P)H-dependent oxidoreductase subunit E [Clostridia bacterium]|nr:NAD(P)H-dependent oxidoreductase subunit E [Clostridia bacterium]
MKITVCIGSSCHVKGSKSVVDTFKKLIEENNIADKVELGGTFCLGNCRDGVCLDIDGKIFSVTPQSAEEFFISEVLSKAI